MERLPVSTLPVIQNIHVPRLVIEKAEILSMDLPTPQQQHMVLYYMPQSISEEDVSTRLFVQQVPCCTGETNHYPSFGIVKASEIVTAPEKGFTFLDATYTANNAMD
ncbi:hypothetical protein TNCV_1271401 [Trichonephila clavipes]|nr:hypothetical protein TNCV_1271401 [Trichonephila clavipes]